MSEIHVELQQGELAAKAKVRGERRGCTKNPLPVGARWQCTPWVSATVTAKLSFAVGVDNFRVVARPTYTDISSGNDLVDAVIRAFAGDIYDTVNKPIARALDGINGRDLREEVNRVAPVPVPANARFDARVRPDGLYLVVSDGGVRLEASNFPGYYARHRDYLGFLTPISTPLDDADSAFKKVAGLAGSCSSFEATNLPGYYLRHSAFRVRLDARDGSRLFDEDATFCERGPLTGAAGASSFESFNFPGRYLRHTNLELWIHPADGSALFNSDATFFVRPQ